jgi:hypothetical protein
MSIKNCVIPFSNKGKSVSRGLPFLQFCKKYDICNQHELVSGCAYGKITGFGKPDFRDIFSMYHR